MLFLTILETHVAALKTGNTWTVLTTNLWIVTQIQTEYVTKRELKTTMQMIFWKFL